MARHPTSDRYGDKDIGTLPSDQCEACNADDPQVRYAHYLTLAREMDFDAIEAHLWQSFRGRKGFGAVRSRGYIADLMHWVKDQVLSHSNIVDEFTGATLPWWEGRKQVILAMRHATEQKAKAADAQRLAREQGQSTLRHAPLTSMGMVFREPGEDDLEEDAPNAAN